MTTAAPRDRRPGAPAGVVGVRRARGAGGPGALGALRTLGVEAVRLVVPLACAGCGAWDVTICPRCRTALATPRRLDGAAPALPDGLPVWGPGVYREELRRLVLAWKLGGRRDLDPVLDAALARVVDAWLDAVPRPAVGVAVDGAHPGPRGRGELWVVPAPSRAGRALRGRPAVTGLADAVARRFAARGEAARVVAALASRGRSTHHVGNGAGRGRHARVVPRLGMAGREIVLVDDVLTTGETLARCRSAVLAAGGQVRGAVVLAAAGTPATPLRLPSRPRVD